MAKFYLDAGHSRTSNGAAGNGFREEELAFELQNLLGAELSKRRHTVWLSRPLATDAPTNKARALQANALGADCYLALHWNAGVASANGTECLDPSVGSAQKKEIGAIMARSLAQATSKCLGTTLRRGDGRLVQSADVLNYSTMPANTLEVCFITNASDMQKYQNNKPQLVQALADAIEAQFGVGSNNTGSSDSPIMPTIDFIIRDTGPASPTFDFIVDILSSKVPIDDAAVVIYPKGRQDEKKTFALARNEKAPLHWAKRINLEKQFKTKGTFVARAQINGVTYKEFKYVEMG